MNYRRLYGMILGDLFVIMVLTVVGFASHDELGTAGWRLLTTFIPISVAWFFSGYFLGVFEIDNTRLLSQLWRPAVAMFFAGPIAVILRGIWLDRPILPIFAVVLTASASLCIVVWRAFLCVLWRR